MIWNVQLISKSQLSAPKGAVLVCAALLRQGAACLHSTLMQFFCFFSHGTSTMMWSSFAEDFQGDVQYTKLLLTQTETLSYDSSLEQNFYLVVYFSSVTEYILFWHVFLHLPKMCYRHILDLNGTYSLNNTVDRSLKKKAVEIWTKSLWNITEGPDNYLFSACELRPLSLQSTLHELGNMLQRSKCPLKILSCGYSHL